VTWRGWNRETTKASRAETTGGIVENFIYSISSDITEDAKPLYGLRMIAKRDKIKHFRSFG
jgi:hypothetical protein